MTVLRSMLTTFVNTLMSAEADAVWGPSVGAMARWPWRNPGGGASGPGGGLEPEGHGVGERIGLFSQTAPAWWPCAVPRPCYKRCVIRRDTS
jgi:hypothetical protein